MSRVGVLLLLLLVSCRSPSNAVDVIHALDAASRHPVAPAAADAIGRVARVGRGKAESKASVDGDDEKSRTMWCTTTTTENRTVWFTTTIRSAWDNVVCDDDQK